MWIVVDGYNVIRQWPELAMLDRTDLQSGREALLRELQSYRRARRHEITVVFDGRERGEFSERTESARGIGVRYSKRGDTADALIARLVAGRAEGTVVVSSDREVAQNARRQGAACLSAAEFLTRIQASQLVSLKGGDEEERPPKAGKGAARRLPKAERRRERRFRGL
jgi:uncharacterized protein